MSENRVIRSGIAQLQDQYKDRTESTVKKVIKKKNIPQNRDDEIFEAFIEAKSDLCIPISDFCERISVFSGAQTAAIDAVKYALRSEVYTQDSALDVLDMVRQSLMDEGFDSDLDHDDENEEIDDKIEGIRKNFDVTYEYLNEILVCFGADLDEDAEMVLVDGINDALDNELSEEQVLSIVNRVIQKRARNKSR
jgi:hypothetical protein